MFLSGRRPLRLKLRLDAADTFFDTSLPCLFTVMSLRVRPPLVECLRPSHTARRWPVRAVLGEDDFLLPRRLLRVGMGGTQGFVWGGRVFFSPHDSSPPKK